MPEAENRRLLSGREYIGVDKIDGPLIFVSKTHPVGYRELIECVDKQGHVRLGIVLESSTNVVVFVICKLLFLWIISIKTTSPCAYPEISRHVFND